MYTNVYLVLYNCEQHLLGMLEPLGGVDEVTNKPIVVEIDELKFFHRKYHRGMYGDGFWVLGMI
jgi:hypothetical protein